MDSDSIFEVFNIIMLGIFVAGIVYLINKEYK